MKKKILLILIIFTLFMSYTPVFAKNVEKFNYTKEERLASTDMFLSDTSLSGEYGYPVYDFIDDNGNYNNLYMYDSGDTIFWTKYDSSMKEIKTININLPEEYKYSNYNSYTIIFHRPFGGGLYVNGNLYFLIGRNVIGSNQKEQNVIGLFKYDTDGNLIKFREYTSKSLTVSSNYNTSMIAPFTGSGASLTYNNGVIGLFFGGNRYDSHQGSKLTFFDSESLEQIGAIMDYVGTDNPNLQQYFSTSFYSTSHSFGQRIIATSDGNYLLAEQGDALIYRGMLVTKLINEESKGFNTYNLYQKKMIHFSEVAGAGTVNNIINSLLGNIFELSDGYLFVGATDPVLTHKAVGNHDRPLQIVVQKYKKDFKNLDAQNLQLLDTPQRVISDEFTGDPDNRPYWLTLYGNEVDYGLKFLTNLVDNSVMMVRAVELENENIAIIWQETDEDPLGYFHTSSTSYFKTYYMVIDKDANIIKDRTPLSNASMSGEEHYVYHDGYIMWTSTSRNVLTINKFDPMSEDIVVKGDINDDGEINLTDILMGLKIFFKSMSPTSLQLDAADVNGDSEINLTDILMLLKLFFNK